MSRWAADDVFGVVSGGGCGRNEAVCRQFDRSAATYDAHARVQRAMASRLAASVAAWRPERQATQPTQSLRVLEIGCGTGALTELLAAGWPQARITALDLAPAMIAAAHRRCEAAAAEGCIDFLCADAENWAAAADSAHSFDLIVSSACFQWLSSPPQTLRHLRRLLRTGGELAFATFGPDTFRELHQSFADVYRSRGMQPQRHGLLFLAAPQWEKLLADTGFSSTCCERTAYTETYASAREFLLSVKETGARASQAASLPGLGSRRLFAEMYSRYEQQFSVAGGGVAATYDVLMFRASG